MPYNYFISKSQFQIGFKIALFTQNKSINEKLILTNTNKYFKNIGNQQSYIYIYIESLLCAAVFCST